MTNLGRLRPSPAMVVATVSLIVALSGIAWAQGKIRSQDISRGAVTSPKIDRQAVKSGKLARQAVKSGKLARRAVKGGKLAPGSVKPGKIQNGAVGERKISDGAVRRGKIQNGAVNAEKIEDGAVNAAKIENGVVGPAKIADGAVETEKLSPGAQGVALAGANIAANGNVRRFFNRFGGEPAVNPVGTGIYTLTFPGLEGELTNGTSIVLATLQSDAGEIRVTSSGSNPQIRTFTSAGVAADRAFEMVAFLRSP